MSRPLLGMLEPSVVFQVNRDAGCSPGVTSNRGEKIRRLAPLPDSRPGVVPVQSASSHCRSSRINALEQGLPRYGGVRRRYTVQYLLEQVMHSASGLMRVSDPTIPLPFGLVSAVPETKIFHLNMRPN